MIFMTRNILLWLIIVAFIAALFANNNFKIAPNRTNINYSTFIKEVNQGMVSSVTIDGYTIQGTYKSGEDFVTTRPAAQDSRLIDDLFTQNVEIKGVKPDQQSFFRQLIVASFPVLLLLGILFFAMRGVQGGMGGRGNPMSFGRSKARMLAPEDVKTSFKDVAGIEEAKEEVKELVDFLREPHKFDKLGARIPKGILMCGIPGTGKTLLAKAIAGEAGVPFYSISGSDFVEMFVGVGASRVRDMFEQARKNAPCIIFIDEIDAVGRQRGAGMGGGHDEREQTLNQLLVEMDGFEGKEGVIIIAATNRPDVLDPALLRPGRFDRQVIVPLPDIKGRHEILKVHARKVKKEKDVDLLAIARGTPGFSGADLANLINESALFAARTNRKKVSQNELEMAKDRVMMGAERKSMIMDDKEKKLTAYHEAGHAIVGLNVPEHDPVYKVTIIPRGRALGVTLFLPEQDRYSQSKRMLQSKLCSLFGGRAAEALVFGEDYITTGASNDIERATNMARAMVTKWGLSEKLGPQRYDDEEEEVFLGKRMATHSTAALSIDTTRKIDDEVHKLITENYKHAVSILKKHISKLHLMAENLIKYETLGEEQLKDIMKGRKPNPPQYWQEGKKPKRNKDKKVKPDVRPAEKFA